MSIEMPIHAHAEIQVHWFCPTCGQGLTTFLELEETVKTLNMEHDRELGSTRCPTEWFVVDYHYPQITVRLLSS